MLAIPLSQYLCDLCHLWFTFLWNLGGMCGMWMRVRKASPRKQKRRPICTGRRSLSGL